MKMRIFSRLGKNVWSSQPAPHIIIPSRMRAGIAASAAFRKNSTRSKNGMRIAVTTPGYPVPEQYTREREV